MKVFITGGTGYIGSSAVSRLLAHGHTVVALARSDKSAARLVAQGVQPRTGDLSDLDGLRRAAGDVDAVIHAAFNYDDWNKMDAAFEEEGRAVSAMLDGLAGTDRPFVYTSGTGTLGDTGPEEVAEDFVPNPPPWVQRRLAVEWEVLTATARKVRGIVLRPGLVYGRGGSGIVNLLIRISKQANVGRTIGTGENAWSVVHVDDLGEVYALAVEKAPGGTVLHATVGKPVVMKDIAAAISRTLGQGNRTEPWPVEEARQQFSFADSIASEKRVGSARTQALLGWTPTQPSIIEELEHGSYVATILGN